jgi:hypothetical protein
MRTYAEIVDKAIKLGLKCGYTEQQIRDVLSGKEKTYFVEYADSFQKAIYDKESAYPCFVVLMWVLLDNVKFYD